MRPNGPEQAPRRAGLLVGQRIRPRRRALTLLAPVAIAATGLWVLVDYSAVADVRIVVLELVAAAVATVAALSARSVHARRALSLLSAYVTLTLVDDAYWLLSVDPSGLSYTLDEFEPGFTVAVEVVRYLPLALLLSHARPGRAHRDPLRQRAPANRRSSERATIGPVQATTGAAALVLLCTPAGALVGDGTAYSVFCFFDVAITATAIALVLSAVTSPVRPDRRVLRRLVVTAAGTSGLVIGDAVMVLSQTWAWTAGGAVGLALAVAGTTLLVAGHLRPAPGAGVSPAAVPPAPARAGAGPVVGVALLVQHVLPLLVAVLTTAQVVDAAHATDGSVQVGTATLGTAAAAVVLSVLNAGARARRAHRDGQNADASVRDELTGAYTRRGFTALARQHLEDDSGTDDGWSLALLDLNGFKTINDTCGHDVGDRLLATVSRRAADVLDGHGILARFGGDEFVALLRTGTPAAATTRDLVDQMRRAITAPAVLDGGLTLQVGVAIGLAGIGPGRGADDLASALTQADQHMYAEKRRDRPDPTTRPAGVRPQ